MPLQTKEKVFLRIMQKQLSGIGWQLNKDMEAPNSIWELCTLMEKVFRKTILGLMFGFQ